MRRSFQLIVCTAVSLMVGIAIGGRIFPRNASVPDPIPAADPVDVSKHDHSPAVLQPDEAFISSDPAEFAPSFQGVPPVILPVAVDGPVVQPTFVTGLPDGVGLTARARWSHTLRFEGGKRLPSGIDVLLDFTGEPA